MSNITCILLFVAAAGILFPAEPLVRRLPELLNPSAIQIDIDQIYITEGPAVYIYSLSDFKLKKKFGRSGEGPREFKVDKMGVDLQIQGDRLIVNSIGKVSFLNRNGDFLKEVPVSNGGNFKPLGDRFVGIRRSADRKANYEILDLYDADLKKLKEIYSKKDVLQPGQDILLGKAPLGFSTTANAVFVNPDEDFLIKVFDAEGRYVSTLERDYEPKEISEEEQNAWHKDLEMTFPDVYPRLKHRFKFTSHWAAIRRIKVDGQLLYIITFRKHGDKLECFRYNTSTRLMKKVLLPVAFQSAFAPYPYCIKRGKVYQLVEDATHEKWELRITPFDQT